MDTQEEPRRDPPFTQAAAESVAALGEAGLIESIREWLGESCPPRPHGIGDDCAVIPSLGRGSPLLTTDSLTFGRHFDDSVAARDAGRKLVNRNLSDIAAMGGQPGPALFSLLCGPDLRVDWIERFVGGMAEACRSTGVQLVGGDVSELPAGRFSAVLSLTGTAERPLRRDGARAGDGIYVTGALGGSLLGHHYRFEPRMAPGAWLAERQGCTALMDLTDGLAKDLPSLVPPGCAAAIETGRVPVSEDAGRSARTSGKPAIEHAFCDGEDYELLLTVDPAEADALEGAWARQFPSLPLTRIGRIVEEPEAAAPLIDAVTGTPLPWLRGFHHLDSSRGNDG